MRFSIAIFATIALSAFTSATPVVVRDASVPGLQSIFLKLQATVTPITSQLASIQPNVNATGAVVKPLINQLTAAISGATTEVRALKGQPQSVVLSSASSNEVVPLQNVAKLVADVLILVIGILIGLFKIFGPGGDLTPILPPVGAALSLLIGAVLVAAAGIVTLLTPLVTGIILAAGGIVFSVGLGPLIISLGL